jgi:hypothetical protein
MLVDLREDVLERVLRVVAREPERLHDDRVDVAREALDERRPRVVVAGAATRDQLAVGECPGRPHEQSLEEARGEREPSPGERAVR